MRGNQLSRYGALSAMLPFVTGKVFFLISASEEGAQDFVNDFPPDDDGRVRVFTTWADVIVEAQTKTAPDCVVVSPLFTTAPTLAQIDALNAAKTVVIQGGNNLPDGSYLATKGATSFATATTIDLFQVNGRIKLLDIIGEIVTTIGAAQTSKFLVLPTVGSSTDLCVAANTAALAVGGSLVITGALTASLVATTQSAVLAQASPLLVKAGKIQINNATSSSGNVRFRVRYIPLDPGAFVSPL